MRTTFRSTYACCTRVVCVLHSRCTRAARCCTRVARALHARCVRVTAVLCPRGVSSAAADLIEGDERESVKRLCLADLLKNPHAACSVQHATGSVRRPQTSVQHAPRPRTRRPMCVQADTWRPIGASGAGQSEGAVAHPVASGAAVVDELVQLGSGHEVLRRGLHQLSSAPPLPRCLRRAGN